MANEEKTDNKEEGKSCCPCGKSSCCCKKAVGALALLVVGGIAGYFAGRHCSACAMEAHTPAAVSAPAAATPAK